jgi:hypothetical protein
MMALSWNFFKGKKADGLRTDIAEFNATVQNIQSSAKTTSHVTLSPITSSITESIRTKQELLKKLEETDNKLNSTLRELTQVVEKSRKDGALVEDMESQISDLIKQKGAIESEINRKTAGYDAAKAKYESELGALQKEKDSVEGTLSTVDSKEMGDALGAIKAHQSAVEECVSQLRILDAVGSGRTEERRRVKEAKPWLSDSMRNSIRVGINRLALIGVISAIPVGGYYSYPYVKNQLAKTAAYIESCIERITQPDLERTRKLQMRADIARKELAMKQELEQKQKEKQEKEKILHDKAEKEWANARISSIVSKLTKLASSKDSKSAEAANVLNLIVNVPEHLRLNLATNILELERVLRKYGWSGTWKEAGALEDLRRRVIFTQTGKSPEPITTVTKAKKSIVKKTVKKKIEATKQMTPVEVKPQVITLTEKQIKKVMKIGLVKEAVEDFNKNRMFSVAGPKTSDSPEERLVFLKALGIKKPTPNDAYKFSLPTKPPVAITIGSTSVKVAKIIN